MVIFRRRKRRPAPAATEARTIRVVPSSPMTCCAMPLADQFPAARVSLHSKAYTMSGARLGRLYVKKSLPPFAPTVYGAALDCAGFVARAYSSRLLKASPSGLAVSWALSPVSDG